MEQVPEAAAKEGFDRILKAVQESARRQAGLLEGQVQEALVEEINDHDPSLVTARLSNNMIVHIRGDASMIGSYVRVRLVECRGFYYFGEVE